MHEDSLLLFKKSHSAVAGETSSRPRAQHAGYYFVAAAGRQRVFITCLEKLLVQN